MPNWCSNTLTITGNTEIIENLPWYEEDCYLYQAVDNALKLPPVEDWMEFWGSKWDCSIILVDVYPESNNISTMILDFDSAWAPPINGIINLAKIYPELKFQLQYTIAGEVDGELNVKAGKLISHLLIELDQESQL